VLKSELDAQRARADEIDPTAMTITFWTLIAVFVLAIIGVVLFVFLRNWKRSPVYKVFTWQ